MWNHVPATKVLGALGPELFHRYFKFCVEREPVEKCISQFSMLRNSPHHNSGNEFLTWDNYIKEGKFPVDHGKYLDEGGCLLVDRILHYENLAEQLTELMDELGVPFSGLKSRAKSGFREGMIKPDEVTEAQRSIIFRAFEPSLSFTGYGE